MANIQRISRGFPFAVYVNETGNKQRISRGVYLNETVTTTSTFFMPQRNKIILEGESQ